MLEGGNDIETSSTDLGIYKEKVKSGQGKLNTITKSFNVKGISTYR